MWCFFHLLRNRKNHGVVWFNRILPSLMPWKKVIVLSVMMWINKLAVPKGFVQCSRFRLGNFNQKRIEGYGRIVKVRMNWMEIGDWKLEILYHVFNLLGPPLWTKSFQLLLIALPPLWLLWAFSMEWIISAVMVFWLFLPLHVSIVLRITLHS